MKENEKEIQESDIDAVQQPKSGSAGVKVRKILNIVLDVILYLFLAFSLFMLVITLVSGKNDGAANVFGYEMRIVASSSMEKSENSVDVSEYKIKDLKLRSMVFIDRVPEDEQKAKEWYASLEEGDVLTFRYVIASSQETITHRITKITPTDNGYIINLQGDNRSGDTNVSTQTIYTSPEDYPNQSAVFNYVIGKVVGKSTALGYIAYAVSQPAGLACIVIVPCSIIIIWQVVRVILAFSEDRKKKAAQKLAEAEQLAAEESREREKQAQELEELKRKIAELEKQQPEKDGDDGGVG